MGQARHPIRSLSNDDDDDDDVLLWQVDQKVRPESYRDLLQGEFSQILNTNQGNKSKGED